MLSTAMPRRIEHIAAELLICRSPASICNYIFYVLLGGFSTQKALASGAPPQIPVGELPTPPSWPGGVPPSRTLPGAAPPTTSPHPLPHPRRCPPPPNSWIRHALRATCKRSVCTPKEAEFRRDTAYRLSS